MGDGHGDEETGAGDEEGVGGGKFVPDLGEECHRGEDSETGGESVAALTAAPGDGGK